MELVKIGTVRSPFPEKFGIPRQSGLAEHVQAEIVMEPEYRSPNAFRGITGFSHLWILWGFHKADGKKSLTVRPPRLGGNTKMGVFATRSPFRPNAIGLSVVRLSEIRQEEKRGTVLVVSGADMLDGTPVYDIKPYIPYADSVPDAVGGFTEYTAGYRLTVRISPEAESFWNGLAETERTAFTELLSGDPRPAYQENPERTYGMCFGEHEVHFKVASGVLTVLSGK